MRSERLEPLRPSRRLARAAIRHSRDMVRRRYFAHGSLSGASFVDRIRRTGYLRGARRWIVAENLAWGAGTRASAAAIVDAWMRSPGHRRNILTPAYRHIGIGIASGAPSGIGRSATYTTRPRREELARRRRLVGGLPGRTPGMGTPRLMIVLLGAAAFVVGATAALALGSWWILFAVLALHAAASAGVVGYTLNKADQSEDKPDPVTAARIESQERPRPARPRRTARDREVFN